MIRFLQFTQAAKASVLITASIALTVISTNLPVRGAELELKMQPAESGQKQDGELILVLQGKRISAVQIDLQFDLSQVSVEIEPAPSLAQQQKELAQSKPKEGVLRVMIFGKNAKPLTDGPLLKIHLIPSKGTAEQNRVLRLANQVAASPEGEEVHVVLIDSARAPSPQRRR